MTDTVPPPDWDVELRALRAAANAAGILGEIDPRDHGVELESIDELLARLTATATADGPADELAVRRRRTRQRVLLASGVAAAGLLVTSVVQPWGSSPVEAATPAILDYEFAPVNAIADAAGKDPSATLARLADAAAGAPDVTGSGTQYVVTDSWFADLEAPEDDGPRVLIPQINETFLGPDGSLKVVDRRGQPLSSDGRGLPRGGAWEKQTATSEETQPAGTVDPDLAVDLSTDPATLRDELLELSGCPTVDRSTQTSLCLYDQVVGLHQSHVVPPSLDAAIWRLIDGEDGFRSLGSVKDRVGRDGVGISLISADRPEYRLVVIADPGTGRLLGTEQILIRSVPGVTIEAPAITSFTAILESEYVD